MRQPSATEKYKAVTEGRMAKSEFVRQMRQQFPNIVSTYDNFDSTVKVLKYKGMIFEAWSNPSKNLSDDSIRRGMDIEIAALGHDPVDCSDAEVQEKARAKAIANIEKDPLHYYNLLAKESSKVDKNDKMKETKRGALEKDTFNDMKKATLKEAKLMTEGTRALVGYLSGDRLTTTYNHYDGYPSNLGVGLEKHYNDDEKAKEVAMKGYITYLNPESGEIESTHNDAPKKITLPEDTEQRAREIAEEIDSMAADYGYIWVDEANMWTVVKNTGIRSMIDQIISKISEGMYEADLEETEEEYLEKRDAAIKKAMGKDEMLKESLSNVIAYLKQEKGAGNEVIKDFIKTHGKDIAGMSMDQVGDEFEEFLSVNYEAPSDFMEGDKDGYNTDPNTTMHIDDEEWEKENGRGIKEGRGDMEQIFSIIEDRASDSGFDVQEEAQEVMEAIGEEYEIDFEFGAGPSRQMQEKKGKDHDGDGDVDGDDYMAAKDKAIKKAMGKDKIKEAVKSIVTKVLEEQTINEAATNELARIADDYAGFEGMKSAILDLQNIVSDIEGYYDKTRDKIQKIYDKLGEIRNEEGLKVGGFLAPAIESAFNKDLRPITKTGFTKGLETPKVKTISSAEIDAARAGGVQQEAPKDTVFSPVNEKK